MVGTAVGLCAVSGLFIVVAVDAAEVAGIETHLFVDVPCATKTDGVAVAGKGGVLLVTVAQTVVGTLAATTDGKLVIDVVLHTGKNLMGTMRQFLLAVIGHLGILVVEEVILKCSTEFRRELVACSDTEQRRHVVACTGTILIRSSVGTES